MQLCVCVCVWCRAGGKCLQKMQYTINLFLFNLISCDKWKKNDFLDLSLCNYGFHNFLFFQFSSLFLLKSLQTLECRRKFFVINWMKIIKQTKILQMYDEYCPKGFANQTKLSNQIRVKSGRRQSLRSDFICKIARNWLLNQFTYRWLHFF